MKVTVLSVAVGLAILAPLCAGATYRVAPDGSDDNPGSAEAPWATLQHAVDAIAPGDTVVVADGTYEGFRIRKSGTPEAVKTIKAENRHKACIDRPGALVTPKANIEISADNFRDGVSYWVIDGLESKNAELMGFRLSHARHVTVRNCMAHHNGKVGIFSGFMWDCVWEDNISHHNKAEGFYNSNSGDYNIIRRNYSHHNGSAGFHNNGDVSMGGDGMLSHNIVEKNISADNGPSSCHLSFDGMEDSIIRNNLCHGPGKGIALYGIDAAAASRRNLVVNNTLVIPAEAWYTVTIRNHNPDRPPAVANRLFNNILYHAPGSEAGSICVDRSALEGFESDYNVVSDRFGLDDNAMVLDFEGWRGLGYGRHSLLATPEELFVDAAGDDFHLKDGSPAVDAGRALAEVTDDLEGKPRPEGAAFDIGCYETPATAGAPDDAAGEAAEAESLSQ